jgi:periplasmic mercuric ion binding protein
MNTLELTMQKIILGLVFTIASFSAWAKSQTITLDLPTMNCAMCPITVKKALTKVQGVTKAEVSYGSLTTLGSTSSNLGVSGCFSTLYGFS